ncbi:hypothetical protein LZZ85_11445 [Terrimonas sp. NA20]|uniref:Uncharacterized protein n=1 Tax=Terrimonas ginsenosidimutans TaxID=2908004 RepID=A0ABS9KRE8_9BACT|nr:hypothetical protein [Terrimonas ginsenosidimutans]MCG2614903.1 hypothetical protein [Terrimonas ginsenosidimutans]
MKQIFFVGVYLAERVHFGLLGFTSYVYCYTEATSHAEAGAKAKGHFEQKLKICATGTRPQIVKPEDFRKFASPSDLINFELRNS